MFMASDPALIHSTAKMDWPFEDRYFNFLAYQDTLGAVPPAMRHLPVYLTEFDNCDGPWTDVNDGMIQNMIMEVDSHNRDPVSQKIHCAICYRWSGDRWALEGKPQRLADFAQALALGIESPTGTPQPGPEPEPPEPPTAGNAGTAHTGTRTYTYRMGSASDAAWRQHCAGAAGSIGLALYGGALV